MSRDRREEILSRLVDVAKLLPGVRNVYRNRLKLTAGLRPAIVILDGDEEGTLGEFTLGRPPLRPSIMQIKPLVCLMAGDNSENIGSDLSALRLPLVLAVLTDDLLQEMAPVGIQYLGCSMDLGQGQTIEGTLILSFELHYPLTISEML